MPLVTSTPADPARRSRDLGLILLLALAARVLRIVLVADVVETEGSEYGRIATNLLQGNGYVGLIEGPELMLPPLYPYAIAATAGVLGADVETAGRIVSCLASLVTVAACWLLALRAGGPGAARWTGWLTALGTPFVLTGSAVFSEGLLMAGLAVGLVAFERAAATRLIRWGLATGGALGLAYLARVESVLIAPGAVGLLAAGWPRRGAPGRTAWPAALACGAAFVLVAAPYPLWVHQVTGEATFAGKSARVFATIERFSRGMEFEDASYALGSKGEPEGPWLTPNEPWRGPGTLELLGRSPGPILKHLWANMVQAGWILASGKGVVSILWLLPIWLAWRTRERSRSTRALDALLLWLLLHVAATAAVYKVLLRYAAPIAIPAVIWAGRGLAGRPWALVGVAVLLLSTSRGFLHGHAEFDECRADPHASAREMGDLLRGFATAGDVIMADDSRAPYYAGTWWAPTPVTDSHEQLIAYARAVGARFVVVTIHYDGCRRPGSWLNETAPPAGITSVATSSNGRMVILRID